MSKMPLRVLLVNSHADGRHSLENQLRRDGGIKVVTATNAADCLRKLREGGGNFHAVLFDVEQGEEARSLKPVKRIERAYPHIKTLINARPRAGRAGRGAGVDSSRAAGIRRELGLASYLTVASECQRLRSELRQREQERDWLDGVLGFSGAITSSLNPSQVALEIYKLLGRLIPGMDAFYLAVYKKKLDALHVILAADGGKILRKFDHHLSNKQEWGLAGEIIKRRKPIFVEDLLSAGSRTRTRSFRPGKGARTYFGFPLMSGNELLGVLSVQSYEPSAFGKSQRRLIQVIANQAAVALDNALLREREASGRVRVLSKLYETMSAVRTALNLEEVLNLIVGNLQELFGLDTCTIGLLDQNKTRLEIVAERGLGLKVTRPLEVFPKDLVSKVLDAGELVEIANVNRRPALKRTLVRHDIKSLIILPLPGKDSVQGLITMGSTRGISLPPEQRELLTALADQAAIAIENARLHKQTERWVQQLEKLGEMTLDITSYSGRDELLSAILRMAEALLQSSAGGIYLYSEKGDELILETAEGEVPRVDKRLIKQGRGLLGRVLKSGQPLAVPDYRHWRGRLKSLDSINVMSAIASPILFEGRVLGAIVVHDNTPGRCYTPHDKKLLQSFAQHAGAAIQRAQKALKERAELIEEEEIISKVTHALTVEFDYRRLLRRVTEVLGEQLGYRYPTLFASSELADELDIAIEPEYPRKAPRITRIKVGQGVVGHVAKSGEHYIVSDVKADKLYLPGVLQRGSEIAFPLKFGSKIIGVLDIESEEVNAFGERDVRVLKKVAAALAVAMENARRTSENAQKTAQMKLLADLGVSVARSGGLDEVLQSVAEMMLTACPATFCHILLRTRDQQNVLRVRAFHAAGRKDGLDWGPQLGELCYLLTDNSFAKLVRKKSAESLVFGGKRKKFVKEFARHVRLKGKLDSALLIPLRGDDGDIIGVCVMGEMREWGRSSFTRANIQFATALASHAATAVEKERAHELAAERTTTMNSLHRVGNAMTGTLDLKDVLHQIVEAGQNLLQAEVCSIFLMRRQGFLSLETSIGTSPGVSRRPVELKVEMNNGLTGHIAKVGRLFNKHGPSLREHPAVINRGPQSHLPSRYCHSMLAIPLKRRDGRRAELIGLIKVENKVDKTGHVVPTRGFDETDTVVLKTLASYAETALQNVRLYNIARSAKNVAEVVNSSLEFEEVLKLVLAELRERIPYDTTSLQLLRGGQLQVVACEGFSPSDKEKVMKLGFPVADTKFPNHRVIQQKELFLVHDIRATGYQHFWDEAHVYCSGNIRAWMGVPLLHDKKPIGMISIESEQPFRYTDEHKEFVVAFARQAASAVYNTMLYKTTRGMLDIILDITQQLDLGTVLDKLAHHLIDKEGIIRADIAVIYPYDPDRDRLDESPVCAGLPAGAQESLNIRRRPGSAVYRMLRERGPRIRNDVRTDPLLYREFARRTKVKSVGVFPLRVGRQSVGVMYVNYLSPHIFDETETALLASVAQKAALIIQHARQYEVVRERFEVVKNAAMNLYAMSAWAHDARKINYDLLGNATLLESSLGKLDREAAAYLEKIKIFSTMLGGLPTPPADLDQMQSVELDEACRAVLDRHESEIAKKRIGVEVDLGGLPPVSANKWLLSEVFHHLIQNAVKALDENGKITISGYVKECHVYVSLSDDGPGIPPAVLEGLFKRRVPSGNEGGTGVGLLLSKMYINACDGELTLKDTGESGTVFVLSLPAAD